MDSNAIATAMRGGTTPSRCGRLIAIEGASGVGKTTAVTRLAGAPAIGPTALTLKLPSPGPLGTLARDFVERGLHETVALTAAADRAFVAEVEIGPALATRRTVIVDRYVVSALALNRMGGLAFDESHALCARLPPPDVSVLLVGDPDAIKARLRRREQLDRYERGDAPGGLSEHEAFLGAAAFLRRRGWHIVELDTSELDPVETVTAIVRAITKSESGR